MKEAIAKAIEGGWDEKKWFEEHTHICSAIFLDSSFWQALGKALGWAEKKRYAKLEIIEATRNPEIKQYLSYIERPEYINHWHSFIDHLAEGKDADQFFKDLLTQ